MSAGVGKTYAMLEEARNRAAEGVDVVVGYAEPHIRPETEAVLLALDILPYKLVEYRGATLKEFDLDAALTRKPSICCVDELAHTNAPGMRHAKRWQDIAELLNAGINVYTTLNVQHLESVNDLVERITGVRVRETLPDAVFDAADEVELVDIAPEELLERFRQSKIYRPEQVERATRHFFTTGNLIALRELALRKTADRVDEQIQQHRRDERLRHVIPAAERVLVCVGPSPLSARLVRSARRLASGLRGKLIAVSVEPLDATRQTAAALTQLDSNLKLAEQLGAQVVTLSGDNVAAEVLAYANTHNVTKIVIGKPARPRWQDVLFGAVVDDLIRHSGDIDIYVIRGEPEDGADRRPISINVPSARDWRGYINATLVNLGITAGGWPLYHRLGLASENVLMLYLLGVLWVAARHSRGAAILASLLAVAAFDLVFVPPYYRFAVHDHQYILTFAIMLFTALMISALTYRVRSQTEAARRRERRTAALLGLSADLASARTLEDVAQATQRHTSEAATSRAVLLVADRQQRLHMAHVDAGQDLNAREFGAAQWSFEHGLPAGRGTNTLPTADGTYVPLRGPRGVLGVLGVFGDPDHRQTERRRMIEAFAAQAALAVERAHLSDEARAAWERVEAELVRNTLLSGVSHELRTPLAGITGAASALSYGDLPEPDRQEMLATLVEQTQRMERLITNLLDMTRMEAGGLVLKKEWTPIEEVVGAALHQLDRRLKHRTINTHIAPGTPLVNIDPAAIEQVLTNLLDNAVEYTPADTPIEIRITYDTEKLSVEVAERGPGLAVGSEQQVFAKFFRGQAAGPQASTSRGVGLGLAICRGLVSAHGGAITAANRPTGGASFTFTLPIGGTPPKIAYDDHPSP